MSTSQLCHDIYSSIQAAVMNARRSDLVAVHPEGNSWRIVVSARMDAEVIESLRELESNVIIINGKVSKCTLEAVPRAYLSELIRESNKHP